MATQWNTSNAVKALKVLYPEGFVQTWFKKTSRYCQWIRKDPTNEGDTYQVNPLFGAINGSPDFAVAKAGKSVPSEDKFNVTDVDYYVIGSIANKLIEKAKNKRGAIEPLMKKHFDAGLYEFGRLLGRTVWGNSGGSIGRVTTGMSSGTITLLTGTDGVHFEKGMVLQASAADGTTGSVRAGEAIISGISRGVTTTTLTTAGGDWDVQITGLIANDHLFTKGSFGKCMHGVTAWIPTSAPDATTFFGVNRTQDLERLSGWRFADNTGKDIETVVFGSLAYADDIGSEPTIGWLHSKHWATLTNSLHGKTFYDKVGVRNSEGEIGFTGFKLFGVAGDITLATDRDMPTGRIFFTNEEAQCMISAGELPHFEKQSGDKLLTESSSDGKEFRIKAYFNYVGENPLDSGWGTL